VNTITRKTVLEGLVNEIDCTEAREYIFNFDLSNQNDWYTLIPYPTEHNRPKKFEPKKMHQQTKFHIFTGAQAGIYTNRQIEGFFTRMQLAQTEDGIMTKMARQIARGGMNRVGENNNQNWRHGTNTRIYLDGMISPDFFEMNFKKTFGTIEYWMQKCGSLFAFILFAKFLMEIVCTIIRAFEIQKISKRSANFARIIVSAIFNVFYLTALTTVFQETIQEEKELYDNKQGAFEKKPKNNDDNEYGNNEHNDKNNRNNNNNNSNNTYGGGNNSRKQNKNDNQNNYDIYEENTTPNIKKSRGKVSKIEDTYIQMHRVEEKIYPPLPPRQSRHAHTDGTYGETNMNPSAPKFNPSICSSRSESRDDVRTKGETTRRDPTD
jgi:hypothetical protein